MRRIPTRHHQHNADPTATCVWFDPLTADTVFRVRAGYVAIIGRSGMAFAETFETKAEAINALEEYRDDRRAVA